VRHLLSVFLIISSLIFISCNEGKRQSFPLATDFAADTLHLAKGFTLKSHGGYKELTVRNPWDTTRILQNYILIDKSKAIPENLPQGTIVRTPLSRIAVFSTVHCAALKELNLLGAIKGVCEPEFISVPEIKQGVAGGSIIDLGQGANPSIEKIIELSPEALFISPIEGQSYGSAVKTGIPVIETPDYMEHTPLARSEWIRFYSFFFGDEAEACADSIFGSIVQNYKAIQEKTSQANTRPSAFTDLMYKGVWYTTGGSSFIARLLKDAGASYVWNGQEGNNARPLPFEQVLDKAGNADVWLIKYNNPTELTYSDLENEYKPYSYFEAFKQKHIYVCHTGKTDYYEDLPIHPDYILQDFAYIFHPELFPGYVPRYYFKMKD
jgi:iron complex transport system substrate-binding protein